MDALQTPRPRSRPRWCRRARRGHIRHTQTVPATDDCACPPCDWCCVATSGPVIKGPAGDRPLQLAEESGRQHGWRSHTEHMFYNWCVPRHPVSGQRLATGRTFPATQGLLGSDAEIPRRVQARGVGWHTSRSVPARPTGPVVRAGASVMRPYVAAVAALVSKRLATKAACFSWRSITPSQPPVSSMVAVSRPPHSNREAP
jgi:hypothetical protein